MLTQIYEIFTLEEAQAIKGRVPPRVVNRAGDKRSEGHRPTDEILGASPDC